MSYIINKYLSSNINELRLGQSCAISNNFFVAGAYTDPSIYTNAGSAYIYNLSTISSNIITAQNTNGTLDVQSSAQFGWSCAISNNFLIIGACTYSLSSYSNEGVAYLYKNNGSKWSILQRITAQNNDGSSAVISGAYFGRSCAISENFLVICASNENSNSGAVYIYKNNGITWSILQRITAQNSDGSSNITNNSNFGSSCAISGNFLVICSTNYKYTTFTS